ncbi:MAG: acyl carrier protein [Verrucomicrobiales bacterium]|nr:acyl carrier protein [Verrucomicrobiales bacterium]
MKENTEQLTRLVLTVHRRNGGDLTGLDLDWPLQARELALDSMDLAEIMVAVEREFGVEPFNAPVPPRTWRELLALIEGSGSNP